MASFYPSLFAADDSGGLCWWGYACNKSFTMEWVNPGRSCDAVFSIHCWSFTCPCLQGNPLFIAL